MSLILGSPLSKLSLPNVYPELEQCTLDGSPLVVKNTFIDFSSSESYGGSLRRTLSMPALLSSQTETSKPDTLLAARCRAVTAPGAELDGLDNALQKSPRSCTGSTCTPASTAAPCPTTVVVKNLPEEYTRDMLVDLFNAHGFFGLFDFVYAPIDFGTRASFGYVHVNLISPEDAERFLVYFQDFTDWSIESDRMADVDWSGDHQGFEALVARYRDSPMMHNKVPDEAKPILLKAGIRTTFPAPTKPLKPLRVRQSKARKARTLGLAEIKTDAPEDSFMECAR